MAVLYIDPSLGMGRCWAPPPFTDQRVSRALQQP